MAKSIWVNARFVTQPLTGIQRYCLEVSRRLANVDFIAPAGDRSEYVALTSSPRFRSTHLGIGAGSLTGHLWEQFVLRTRLPADAVLFSPAGCGPVAKAGQVVTIHDIAYMEHPEWYSRSYAAWYRWMLPRLVRSARRILTVSEFSRGRIAAVLGIRSEEISVTPPAVDERFRPLPSDDVRRVLTARGLSRPYFLAVSSLSSRKNLSGLLAAWRVAEPALGDTELVLAGDIGLAFSNMKDCPGLPPGVRHLGRVTDDDLVALYNGATAYVYPSLYEGFGLPILEAMACGVPVVTSNCTSMPEVAGDAAILVDPRQPDDIAGALVRLSQNEPLRRDLRARGLQRALQFTWAATAMTVETVLREVAEES